MPEAHRLVIEVMTDVMTIWPYLLDATPDGKGALKTLMRSHMAVAT